MRWHFLKIRSKGAQGRGCRSQRTLNGDDERWWETKDALDSDLVCNYGPYSEILIVIWPLKCEGSWITANARRTIIQPLLRLVHLSFKALILLFSPHSGGEHFATLANMWLIQQL